MGTIVSLIFFLFYIILLKDNTSLWVGWVILAVGIIISLPFCYMSSKYLGFGCIVCALPAGCSLAMILQVAVIYLVNFQSAIFIMMGAFSLIMIVLCLMFTDHALNIANAITSSYLIMRGIGFIFEYPYEFVL
jgi:hypothetical protein